MTEHNKGYIDTVKGIVEHCTARYVTGVLAAVYAAMVVLTIVILAIYYGVSSAKAPTYLYVVMGILAVVAIPAAWYGRYAPFPTMFATHNCKQALVDTFTGAGVQYDNAYPTDEVKSGGDLVGSLQQAAQLAQVGKKAVSDIENIDKAQLRVVASHGLETLTTAKNMAQTIIQHADFDKDPTIIAQIKQDAQQINANIEPITKIVQTLSPLIALVQN